MVEQAKNGGLALPEHSREYRLKRFINWFPMGLTYAFLYMARYNLTVAKTALGDMMSKSDFGIIFSVGTFTYAFAFLINGPLTDRIGGKKAILIGSAGSAVANTLMGIIIYGMLMLNWTLNLTVVFSLLYAINMYFQSYGAVAIVKVNSAWFHIRERGVFGGIFGILISLGIYFAFDWGGAIIRATVADPGKLGFAESLLRRMVGISTTAVDQTWWVFFIPAILLAVFFIIELFLLKDRPELAGFPDFDTADGSSGENEKPFNLKEILLKILTNPIIITIALIEFCSGVMRNGIMHWYLIFTSDMGYSPEFFISRNWGLLLMLAGSFGGIFAGFISDKIFGSRRGPVAALLYGVMLLLTIGMLPLVSGTNAHVKQEMKVLVYQSKIEKLEKKFPGIELTSTKIGDKLKTNYSVSRIDTSITEKDAIITYTINPRTKQEADTLATKLNDFIFVKHKHLNKFQNKWQEHEIVIKNIGRVVGAPIDINAYALGFIVVFMSLCVIGVHGMLSGTSTMDFGGRRAAATAVGLIDGFVYLGTGMQSISLGFLTELNWSYWPPFLIPFAIIGLVLAIKIWHAFPNARRKGK
ncbi:MFS transporter [candidate division KSB1 bacterium]|nr:MFS transporter [candidate division KSB1 bacterium]